jgi:uncharacterized protein (TIGR00255 family)
MTGFARSQGHDDVCTWTWELKSVNNRGFDVRVRLPQGSDALEPIVRKAAAGRIRRGNLAASLVTRRAVGAGTVRINRTLLNEMLSIAGDLADQGTLDPPRMDGLLALPGMLETVEEDETTIAARQAGMAESFDDALTLLVADRCGEGARLGAMLFVHLDEIEAHTGEAASCAAAQPKALQLRLAGQITEMLRASPTVSEDRLAQEAALLASKADVREEIDRLRAHVSAARALLEEEEAIGRRLDFLCQELNREANTLCSKSSDIALTRVGLSIKAAVEQLREQVQNVE